MAFPTKKPLNTIDTPIYPDIRRAPPRFVSARKHWTVDAGETLLGADSDQSTAMNSGAVLAMSRSANQTMYGQSSHRTTVNSNFRPPEENVYLDHGPLTRIPVRVLRSVTGRVNPGTTSDAGTSGFQAQNSRADDIPGALTDRVQLGRLRVNPDCVGTVDPGLDRVGGRLEPTLSAKLPSVSADSGITTAFSTLMDLFTPVRDGPLRDAKRVHAHKQQGTAGLATDVRLDAPDMRASERFRLGSDASAVAPAAGLTTNPEAVTFLDDHLSTEARARQKLSRSARGERAVLSTNPGGWITVDGPSGLENRSRSTVDIATNAFIANPSAPIFLDGANDSSRGDRALDSRTIRAPPLAVANPGTIEGGYTTSGHNQHQNHRLALAHNGPRVAYAIPGELPAGHDASNFATVRHHVRQPLQPVKGYGMVSQTGANFVPS